jgi:hypothetical protein
MEVGTERRAEAIHLAYLLYSIYSKCKTGIRYLLEEKNFPETLCVGMEILFHKTRRGGLLHLFFQLFSGNICSFATQQHNAFSSAIENVGKTPT